MDSGQRFNSVVFETEVVGGAGIPGFRAVFLAELPHQGIALCYIRKFVTEFKSWCMLGDDYFIFFLGYCDAEVMVTFSVVCVSKELLESVDYLFWSFSHVEMLRLLSVLIFTHIVSFPSVSLNIHGSFLLCSNPMSRSAPWKTLNQTCPALTSPYIVELSLSSQSSLPFGGMYPLGCLR